MAYEKNTWNTGDTITADLLNHIEIGVEEAHNLAEFTTYHMIVDGENETIQTDLPNVTDWDSFISACEQLSATPSQLYIKGAIPDVYGGDTVFKFQFMGFINYDYENATTKPVFIAGSGMGFAIGDDEGEYASIEVVFGYVRSWNIYGYIFVS